MTPAKGMLTWRRESEARVSRDDVTLADDDVTLDGGRRESEVRKVSKET
jgi:hypothetical protein